MNLGCNRAQIKAVKDFIGINQCNRNNRRLCL